MRNLIPVIALLISATVGGAEGVKPQMSLVKHDPHDLIVLLDHQKILRAYPAKEIATAMAKNIRTQMMRQTGLVAMEVDHGTAWVRSGEILAVMVVKHPEEPKIKPTVLEPPKKQDRPWYVRIFD